MATEADYTLLFFAAGSFAIGGFCYYAYSESNGLVAILEDIPRYSVGRALVDHVANTKSGSLSYVAVTGQAKPDDKTITGIHNTSVEGLIQNIYVKEHRRERLRDLKSWGRDTRNVSKTWSTEPFSLCNDSGKFRVSIKNPLEANDLKLTTIYDKYEPVVGNFAEKMFDYMTGQRVVGIQTVEKMLLPNVNLTAIGQVILHDGQLHIDHPEGNLKYFLTKDSIDSLVKSEQSTAIAKKVVSYVFLGIGGFLCLYWLYQYYNKYLSELAYNRLEQENNFSDSDNTCVICLSSERNIVLIPCGHVCICKECVKNVTKCPICRKIFDRVVPMYRS